MKKRSRQSNNWKLVIFTVLIKLQMLLKSIINRLNPSLRVFWESQYLAGDWDHLKDISQVPLYSVLVGYFQFFKQGGSILDVGCGEGVFQERLGSNSYSRYIGTDISDEAIRRASSKQDDKTKFMRSDANDFYINETFDAIVFSEVLYYFEYNLIANYMKKYEQFLKKDGIFIISMKNNPNTAEIWNILDSIYPLIDKTYLSNKSGKSWTCKVYLPSDQKNY